MMRLARLKRWLPWLVGLAGAGAGGAFAADDCRTLTALSAEDLATYQFESDERAWEPVSTDRRYRLGEVSVVRQNVFEQEQNWLHATANRYHRRTRESTVRDVLPVASGDPVDHRILAEAERILRNKIYLYDARVIPRRVCGEVLDVFVVTRDVWTLMPQVSLARTGSENDVGFGINETNLLGRGQYISLGYEKDKDRRGVTFAFGDPNLGDSRWALDVALVDNNDGERAAASLTYPFYALATPRALGVSVDDFRREEGLYFLGEEIWEYRADTRTFRGFTGWSSGRRNGAVNRLLVGFAHENYRFDLPDAFADIDDPQREYNYPFVAFQRLEDDFETRVNLDRVQRTEDIALGAEFYAELGYSPDASDQGQHLIARVRYNDAVWLASRQLMAFRAWLDGYYDLDDHSSENLAAGALVSYRHQHGGPWSLLVQGSVSAIRNPSLDQQLLLGGELGLRGYPNRYQTGDRRFLLTVEERYYSNLYPLRMFRLGAAVFFDVGRAWYEGERPAWLPPDGGGEHLDVLANVGFGLRMESTRTRGDQIVHLDVAFPMQDGPGVRAVEVTLTAKATL